MSKIVCGFDGMKNYLADVIKTENDSYKHSSECKSYKMSKEEIEKYLSKYDR